MSDDILERTPPSADARIRYGSHDEQFGDLRLPGGSGPFPVVVVIHGGFWQKQYDLVHMGHVCADITNRGFVTWSIEYRRIGHSGGRWPGTFEDVDLGVGFLTELAGRFPLDLSCVVVLGFSAGGTLALWAGRRREASLEPRGVVALAAISDLRAAARAGMREGVIPELLGGTPDDVPEAYQCASPIELLPVSVPHVLVHGTSDDQVPFEHSARYHEQAMRHHGADVQLSLVEAGGHFDLIDPRSAAWPRVVAAVEAFRDRR